MDGTLDDDYTGTFVNITGIYKNDKVFIFRSTGKDINTLKIDRDLLLKGKIKEFGLYILWNRNQKE